MQEHSRQTQYVLDGHPHLKQLYSDLLDYEVLVKNIADDSTEVLNQMKRLVNNELELEGWQPPPEVELRTRSAEDNQDKVTANLNEMLGLFRQVVYSTRVQRCQKRGNGLIFSRHFQSGGIEMQTERSSARECSPGRIKTEATPQFNPEAHDDGNSSPKHTVTSNSPDQRANEDLLLRCAVLARDMLFLSEEIGRQHTASWMKLAVKNHDLLHSFSLYRSPDHRFRGILRQIVEDRPVCQAKPQASKGDDMGVPWKVSREGLHAVPRDSCDHHLDDMRRLTQQMDLLKHYEVLRDAYIQRSSAEFKLQIQIYNTEVDDLQRELNLLREELSSHQKDYEQLLKVNHILKKQVNQARRLTGVARGSRTSRDRPGHFFDICVHEPCLERRQQGRAREEQLSQSTYRKSDRSMASTGLRRQF